MFENMHPMMLLSLTIVTIIISKLLWNFADYLTSLLFKKDTSDTATDKEKTCDNCLAMQNMKRIPTIEEKQRELREEKLPLLGNQLSKIDTTLLSLNEKVNKLFDMIEEVWRGKLGKL